MANKVTHTINCAGRQVPNHWEPIGVKYLTYFWLDQDSQVILDPKDQVSNECYAFISEALEKGDSVLVHSVKGQSRCCTIVASWIMRRYQWTLLKTLEFLNSRRPDLEIRANFIHQLTAYENRLVSSGLGPKTSKWTEVSEKTNDFENEELLLRNTYLNAQMGPFADFSVMGDKQRPAKIKWIDDSLRDKKLPLSTVIEEEPKPKEQQPQTNSKNDLVPIMKSSYTHSRNAKGVTESASSGRDKASGSKITNVKERPVSKQYSARDPAKPEEKHTAADIRSQTAGKKMPGAEVKISGAVKPISEGVQKANVAKSNAEMKGNFIQTKSGPYVKLAVGEKPAMHRFPDDVRDAEIRIMPKFNNFIDPELASENASVTGMRSQQKPLEYGSKISESINQMMDLNAAISEKCGLYKNMPAAPKTEGVTHIINQNNINNYIIHNPQKIEVIEYTQSKVDMRVQPEPIVKKIIPPKKTAPPVRSSSATVRRDQPVKSSTASTIATRYDFVLIIDHNNI